MSDRIHELLNRNLQEVFGEGDAARRRAAIEELYTEDCVLYVPVGIFVGRDALDKFAGDLRATHPHFAYTPRGEPQALHNAGRLAWGSGPRGERPDYTGLDVIIVRGTQLRDHAIDRLPSSNSLEREFAQELRPHAARAHKFRGEQGQRWRSLHIDSMREVRLTAGPMTVKSRRASPPMLPYITSPTCNARP